MAETMRDFLQRIIREEQEEKERELSKAEKMHMNMVTGQAHGGRTIPRYNVEVDPEPTPTLVHDEHGPALPPQEVDMVNQPPHYRAGDTYETIRVIEAWNLGFNLGNTVKYISRWQSKGGVEDLKKARWYLDREIAKRDGKA